MSDGKHVGRNKPTNTLEFFLQSDMIFTVFFIFESFISILADGLKKSIRSFWGLFNIFIFISSIATLCGLTNLSPFRLWIILRYLSKIPLLSDIDTILKALRKSFSVLRDIAVFAIFLFVCAGIVGVSIWGGKFKYRCINEENEFYDEDLVCSMNPNYGYQCPQNFNCTKVDDNPAYNTVGFDNAIQAWLTVFQILTTEGWSEIMINGMNSANGFSIIFFLFIIMFGNWLLLQLIVATVTSNLEKSIENGNFESKKDDDITTITDNDNISITENIKVPEKNDTNNINKDKDTESEKSVVHYNSEMNNLTSQTVIEADIGDEQSIRTVSIHNLTNTTTTNNNEITYPSTDLINESIEIKSNHSKSEGLLNEKEISFLRRKLMDVFLDIKFDYFVLIITTIDVIGLCSNHKDSTQRFIDITHVISVVCTIIFGIEMVLKLYAFGLKGYLSSFFNIFDGLITVASFVELVLPNNQGMLVLRVIRATRILRISKFSKSLVDLAIIIKDSSKQLLSLAVIWVVSIVIFSAICMQIFSGDMNFDDGVPRPNFDTMGNAILAVIQLYTVENWNDIEVSVARSKSRIYILVLIAIIIIGAFVLSQILVAILLSGFTEKIKADMESMNDRHAGKQTKFTIKRALNDLFENVKEKNIAYYPNSIDGDDKSSKGSYNMVHLRNKKRSINFEDDLNSNANSNIIPKVNSSSTLANSNSNNYSNTNLSPTSLIAVSARRKRELVRNNSEPYLKERKHHDHARHKRTLSTQKSFSHSDLKIRNLAHLKMTPYHENEADIMAHDNMTGRGHKKTLSNASSITKNDNESIDSSRIHRRQVTRFFNDDDVSTCSTEYSGHHPHMTTGNSPLSKKFPEDDDQNKQESTFMARYNNYRQSKFVKKFQDLCRNNIYLTFIYIFIISSCISLIFDSPNQKNQGLLNILRYFDIFFSIIFCIELFINLVAYGAFIEKKAYLRSIVNWIDVIVIIISIMSAFRIADSAHSFRVLRVMRLFRLVKLHEGMRIVFMAIWKTIPSLATALIPYLFFLIITSAMGLSMFVGEGWQCNDDSVRNKMECIGSYKYDNGTSTLKEPRLWERYELGYDNILDSIQTSLVITNQEGWPDIMYRYIDSAGIDQQPIRDNRPEASIFYILSVLIGNWIFLAVVTGITFDSMKRNQEILKGLHHLTDGQRKLLDYIALIISYKPKPPPGVRKRNNFQQRLYDFFKSNTYEYIVFFIVLANIIIMLIARSDATQVEKDLQIVSEYVFTGIYIFEVVLLMYAYKPKYFFYDRWNVLNLMITIFAFVSIAFNIFSQPNYLTVFRLLRIVRLLKFARGLKALVSAIIFNFAQLMNVTLLMFITCCIFAIIGMHSFGDIDYHKAKALNEHLNFSTFPRSLLTVFVFSSGENWPVAMTDCSGRNLNGCDPSVENCGVIWAPAFFILLEIIFNWILLNSFIAITVDTFLNVLNDLDEINKIESITNTFRQVWLKYDKKGKGVVEFKEMLKIYREFRVSNNYLWGHRSPVKPSIQKLFKSVVVYNNKCTYADALMSIMNSYIGEQLPDDIKLKYWRKKNYDRVYRAIRNTPMNNTLVMPSNEYYSRSRRLKRYRERRKAKDELARSTKSVPNLNLNSNLDLSLNSISEDITETTNTSITGITNNTNSTNNTNISTNTNTNTNNNNNNNNNTNIISGFGISDTNYHVRPNLRRSDLRMYKGTLDHKHPMASSVSTNIKSMYNDQDSDISATSSAIKHAYEEAIIDMPKYAIPLSTSSISLANPSSSSNSPLSNITININNHESPNVSSPSKLNKGKTAEPESIQSEIDTTSNTNTNESNITHKKPIFRFDSFNDNQTNSTDSNMNTNDNNDNDNDNGDNNTDKDNNNKKSSPINIKNINKSDPSLYSNTLLNEKNNKNSVIRIDSSDSQASSTRNLDITYEINKRIQTIIKNKNSPTNINNYTLDTPKFYGIPDSHSNSTVAFEENSLHSVESGSEFGKVKKRKKFTDVPSSLRNVLKPYSKREESEDENFNVNKDVLQFYVVYAIYRVQVRFRRTRNRRIKHDEKIEIVTNE
jgi:hypothetical protein